MTRMFRKILIANRGEIACRVMRTARRMGIATVAVYSEADAQAAHVQQADEAYLIGQAPARHSYLRGEVILDVAIRAGAEAIHPGYGFLSENADFAEACAARGIVFIGPPAEAIRAMGSKAAAKALMERSGVPLVPGYHGAEQSFATLREAAARIGYPVLLKASAGGGGRGMRVVENEDALQEGIDRARGEAGTAFGDDRLLVEKYLTKPRHIEVQVFGDMHGKIVSLFERDCSVQRRHQKVLEESPAPGISEAQRTALGEAAISAARAVGYVGAGTVEFIYEDEHFYFMEMNTRLQVEHPVTEFVTGLDLVEWQFRVASGEPLPEDRDLPSLRGHAIEARICAEDPEADFMPSTGTITFLRQPAENAFVRVDTGVRQGDTITPFYDSMIAKLIVWDTDRPASLRRLSRALQDYALAGPRTNLELLRKAVDHPEFAEGGVDTGFIARHPALRTHTPDEELAPAIWAAACLACLPRDPATQPGDPFSPWGVSDAWAMNGPATFALELAAGSAAPRLLHMVAKDGGWCIDLPQGAMTARLEFGADDAAILHTDGARLKLHVITGANAVTIIREGRNHVFARIDRLSPPEGDVSHEARLIAPMPSRVVSVLVAAGATVTRGQKLLILESMKVETTVAAPHDGVIEAVHVKADELLKEGARLISFLQEG
jgi:3-methylcrotonyl-CoA carboxylase alpha subunit